MPIVSTLLSPLRPSTPTESGARSSQPKQPPSIRTARTKHAAASQVGVRQTDRYGRPIAIQLDLFEHRD